MGLVAARSVKYRESIKQVFRTDDGNFRYSKNTYKEPKKTYTRAEARDLIAEILRNDTFGAYEVDVKGHKKDLAQLIYEKLNGEQQGKRLVAAGEIADYLIENATAEDYAETKQRRRLKQKSKSRCWR